MKISRARLFVATGAGSGYAPVVPGTFGSALGVLVSLRAPSVRAAQQNLSVISMAIFFAPMLGFQALPTEWKMKVVGYLGSATVADVVIALGLALAVLDVALLLAAMTRFRRDRLVFD